MKRKYKTVHKFSEMHFWAENLLEITFNLAEHESENGEIRDLIYLNFTPRQVESEGNYAIDKQRTQTLEFDLSKLRCFAEGLKLGGISLLEPGRNIFVRDSLNNCVMPSKYRHHPIYLTGGALPKKKVEIHPECHNHKPYLKVILSDERSENIVIKFSPEQARHFGEKLLSHSNNFHNEIHNFQRRTNY